MAKIQSIHLFYIDIRDLESDLYILGLAMVNRVTVGTSEYRIPKMLFG
jgi:hypothetical protein